MKRREYPGPKGRRPLDGYTHVWRVGDRAWSPTANVGAEVVEVGYGAIKVRWDDDQTIGVLHPTDVVVPS